MVTTSQPNPRDLINLTPVNSWIYSLGFQTFTGRGLLSLAWFKLWRPELGDQVSAPSGKSNVVVSCGSMGAAGGIRGPPSRNTQGALRRETEALLGAESRDHGHGKADLPETSTWALPTRKATWKVAWFSLLCLLKRACSLCAQPKALELNCFLRMTCEEMWHESAGSWGHRGPLPTYTYPLQASSKYEICPFKNLYKFTLGFYVETKETEITFDARFCKHKLFLMLPSCFLTTVFRLGSCLWRAYGANIEVFPFFLISVSILIVI